MMMRIMLRSLLCSGLILLFSSAPSFADTTVGGRISADTTWTLANSPYVVTSTVQVYGTSTTPVTLTIEPGVVVKFNAGVGLQIGDSTNLGALIAQGASGNHITFIRSGTAGNWGSIAFNDKTVDATTLIEYADIQYSTGISMTTASPAIRNSTITNMTGYVSLSSSNPTLENVTIAASGSAYGIYLASSNPVFTNVAITTNSTYGFYLSSASPTITGGSFTNTSTAGHGIYGAGSPVISNYSVSTVNTANYYGAYLSSGVTSSFSLTNSSISNGLYLGTTNITPTITGNTFTNVDNSPIHVGANIIAGILSNNTINGMTSTGRIEVVGEQVKQDARWTQQAAPYVVTSGTVAVYKDTTSPATLTIDPGVTIKFASGAGLQVGYSTSKGALVAQGTSGNRITLTRSGTSGTWSGITFYDGTVDSTTILEYCDLSYVTGFSASSASPTVRNSTITNMTGYVSLSSSNPVFDTVTIANTGTYGLYLSSSNPTITGGSLTNSNTAGHGIYGTGSPVISNYAVSIVNAANYYGVYLSSGSTSSLSITNSNIANGLYIGTTNITPTITGNTFTNADKASIHAGANIIANILNNNTINGMTSAGRIEVVGEQVKQDTRWIQRASPYVVTSGTVAVYKDTTGPATLTIDPGVTIKFASGAGLQVASGTNQGALVAQGTSGNRITLTRSGTSGTWGSITFNDGTIDSTTILENVDVQYNTGISMTSASPTIKNSTITDVSGYLNLSSSNPTLENVTIGIANTTSGTYGINLSSSNPTITGGSLTNLYTAGQGIYGSGSPVISNYTVSIVNSAGKYGMYLSGATSALSVTNSTIANGLYIGVTNITPTITGNTFTNVDNAPIHAGANIIAGILNNNTINGMTSAGKIEIVGEQVKQDTRWIQRAAPYVVTSGTVAVYKDTTSPATLTIDPGVTIKFASGAGLQIANGTSQGALVAQGTSSNRITLTRNGTTGTWGSITFNDGTIDSTTIFENVDVQYSTGISMTSASPTIRNSTITNVTGYVSLSSSNPILDTVTITNTGTYGLYLSSSNPTITGGSLTNLSTAGHGIYGAGSPVISNYSVSIVNAANYYGLYLSSGSTSALSVTNSTIANGLYIGVTNITPTITGNTFTNVDNAPIHAGANIIAGILNNNTINGMTSAGRIEVVGEQVKQDARWTKRAAPYTVTSGTVAVYKDTTGPATLTIDPGVTIKFASGAGLQVASGTNQGALVAQGTSGNRITFTRNGTSGNWGSITFYDGTIDSTTIIENVDVQYSTGITMYSASPVIRNSAITDVSGYLNLSTSNPTLENVTISIANTTSGTYGIYLANASPTIMGGSLTNNYPTGQAIYGSGSPVISNYNVSIVNSAGKYGIYLASATTALSITNSTISNGLFIGYMTGNSPTITGNTFTNADNSPIHAGANSIANILSNNTINGMTSAGRIEIVGEQVTQDARWQKLVAPYVVVSGTVSVYKDTTTASTLTIDPGVTIKFGSGAGIQVGYSTSKGVLVAQGNSANRIVFTSYQTTPTAGYWLGISLSGDAAGAGRLEYATIEYAGLGAGYSNANLTLSATAPVIRNCIIRNSAGSGIYLASATNWPVIIDSEITGNKWGVYAMNSNPLITNTKIYSNPTYGVYNVSTTMDVDARDNYWGASTGPTYSGNSRGTGDKINDHVIYNPWLGQAPGTTLSITDAKVLPASLNPNGDYVTFKATISSSATWTITITDVNSVTVKTFTGTGTSINQRWYGDNDQSVKVSDGVYYYTIAAMDSSNNTATTPQGMIMVSSQIPIAIMDPPQDNQMFQSGVTTNITGTAVDSTDFKNYSLDYGAGENPSTWTNLKPATTTQVTNGLLYAWNTSSLTGTIYTVKLTVTDNAGNIATETARVRFFFIQNVAASEGYISPNADGIKDTTTVSASITYQSNWTLTIKNAANTIVRTYTGTGTAMSQAWDGKDGTGTVVPDGTYTYQVDATSTETTVAAAPKTGTVIVDTTNPSAQITAPTANTVLQNIVPVTGTASDTSMDNYKVEYGPASGSGPWNLISSATTSVSSGTLATWVTNDQSNTVLVPNGSYLVRLTVTDKAGNNATNSVPVSVDNLVISNIGISSNTINTNASEISTVFFTISSQATVTFNVIPEKQGPTGAPVYQTGKTCAAGACSFTWDGKNNSGTVVPDEAYLFVLAASDGTRTDAYSPAAPTGTGTITCSQSTGLDPVRNIPLTVTYTPAQPSRINISISWGSQNFKIQDAVAATAGSHTYVWDGRSPTNKLLDYGAQSSCTVASLFRENYIITSGDTISATDIKTDPYAMQLAYGHITRIKYTLPRDANVTVKLTSPTGAVITLINNQLQTAGQQETTWNGLDTTDTTGKKTLVTEEGDYMVSVQVVNPVTGTSATTKGNLRIGY